MWADEIPHLLQWSEGMLLTPQHFQLAQARTEMMGQYSRLISAPYNWGIRRLALDVKALPSGMFRVLDLDAVMPDGSLASHDTGMGDLSVQLTGTPTEDVPVYLVVPERSAPGLKGTLPRFTAFEGDPVAGENEGEGELRPSLLRPNLSLMAEGKARPDFPPKKFVSMQIGCLRFEHETWTQTDYVPPTMTVALHTPLGQLSAALVQKLRVKGGLISEWISSHTASSDATMMLEYRLRMLALVSRLPAIEALLNTESAHPLALYMELCAVAGSVSTLGASLMPPEFPAYRHEDPRPCFETVCDFAMRMTDEGVPENYVAYPFYLSEGIFELFFEPEWIDQRLVLGMRMATGATDNEKTRTWAMEALIGSESIVPSLRDKRILGAPRQFIEQDPDIIPGRSVLLFGFTPDSDFVRKGEKLQVLNFGERDRTAPPVEILLFVKKK